MKYMQIVDDNKEERRFLVWEDVLVKVIVVGIKGYVSKMAEMLYDYTSGYPYLVSRLCKIMDEKLARTKDYPLKKDAWCKAGFLETVNYLLSESNTLFDDMKKKLTDLEAVVEVYGGNPIVEEHMNLTGRF